MNRVELDRSQCSSVKGRGKGERQCVHTPESGKEEQGLLLSAAQKYHWISWAVGVGASSHCSNFAIQARQVKPRKREATIEITTQILTNYKHKTTVDIQQPESSTVTYCSSSQARNKLKKMSSGRIPASGIGQAGSTHWTSPTDWTDRRQKQNLDMHSIFQSSLVLALAKGIAGCLYLLPAKKITHHPKYKNASVTFFHLLKGTEQLHPYSSKQTKITVPFQIKQHDFV